MDNITSKYNYLNNYLKQIWNYHVHKDHLKNHPDKNSVNNLLCLSNQFYYIIKLPNINNTYFSPNTTNILGIHNHSLTIKRFLERIHPKDHETIIEKYIKIFDHIKKNFNSIQALECISNLNFYIKANDKDYLNILQQVCVFNIEQLNKEIQLLFMCTDISPFHSQYSSNNSKCKVINHKAINLFTNRELEILNLLSIGKNSNEIASELYISKHTVDKHRQNMLCKSELGNTAELIAYTYL